MTKPTTEASIRECRVHASEFMNYRFVLKRLSNAKENEIDIEGMTMKDLLKEGAKWIVQEKTIHYSADEDEIDDKLLILNQSLSKAMELANDETEAIFDNPKLYQELADMDHTFNGISILWKLNFFKGGLRLND